MCTRDTTFVVIPGPWREAVCFLMSVRDGTCFRVDTESDMMTDAEMRQHEDLVREADHKEIKSFVSDKVFRLRRRAEATVRPVDCIWVRKWKTRPSKGVRGEVKSRLVVRGFLDPQKRHVSRYASTARRLSQRLLVSLSVEHRFDVEQCGINTACF